MTVLRNLMLRVTLFSVLALPSVTYGSYYYTGQNLKEWADSVDRIDRGVERDGDFEDGSKLIGYVTGYNDTVGRLIHCVPEGVAVRQLIAVAAKYLREHPEEWNEVGGDILKNAFTLAFPCPSQNP